MHAYRELHSRNCISFHIECWKNLFAYQRSFGWSTCRATQRSRRPRGKRGRGGPLRAKRADNFQGVEISYRKSLLVYFMRPLRPWSTGYYEAHWTLKPWGNLLPCPLSTALSTWINCNIYEEESIGKLFFAPWCLVPRFPIRGEVLTF